jgi:hypothetical protein
MTYGLGSPCSVYGCQQEIIGEDGTKTMVEVPENQLRAQSVGYSKGQARCMTLLALASLMVEDGISSHQLKTAFKITYHSTCRVCVRLASSIEGTKPQVCFTTLVQGPGVIMGCPWGAHGCPCTCIDPVSQNKSSGLMDPCFHCGLIGAHACVCMYTPLSSAPGTPKRRVRRK